MSGGRPCRQKGNRLERASVRLLQDRGLGAERVPLSGAAGGSYQGGITVPVLGRDLIIEAKARANGVARLIRIGLAAEIVAAAERGKGGVS